MHKIDPKKLLTQIARVLDNADISYFVTGGMAVVAWGRPRYTADIDTVIELRKEHVETLAHGLKQLGELGYVSTDAMREALQLQREFNFIDGNTGMKVDFWVSKNDEFSRLQLERRIAQEISGRKVFFISPEDLILSKLQWYQKSFSSRQLEDIESVFAVSGDKLDLEYLKQWAEQLGVESVLKQATEKT